MITRLANIAYCILLYIPDFTNNYLY